MSSRPGGGSTQQRKLATLERHAHLRSESFKAIGRSAVVKGQLQMARRPNRQQADPTCTTSPSTPIRIIHRRPSPILVPVYPLYPPCHRFTSGPRGCRNDNGSCRGHKMIIVTEQGYGNGRKPHYKMVPHQACNGNGRDY